MCLNKLTLTQTVWSQWIIKINNRDTTCTTSPLELAISMHQVFVTRHSLIEIRITKINT